MSRSPRPWRRNVGTPRQKSSLFHVKHDGLMASDVITMLFLVLRGRVMRATVRKLGNSSGVIIPKSMLTEIGLATGDAVDLALEEGRIAITPLKKRPREGWAEASRAIAEAGEDALIWPEFGNEGDDELTW